MMVLVSAAWGQLADGKLEQLRSALPRGWTLTVGEHQLEISRTQGVTILDENRINAPVTFETPEQTAARIRAQGRPGHCGLVLRLEPRWSEQHWAEIERHNAQIERELESLPQKLAISDLYDAALSRKGRPIYVAKTESDKRRVAEWQDECDRLTATLQSRPDYTTSTYSLSLTGTEGAEDDLHRVDPPEASQELYEVLNRLGEICPNPTSKLFDGEKWLMKALPL